MHEILNTRTWALESNSFDKMAPLVMKRLSNGGSLEKLIQDPDKQGILAGLSYDEESGLRVFETASNEKVAVISVIGAMSKYGGLCSYGTKHLSAAVNAANKADNIKGGVFIADTPGGAVDGLPEFATITKNSSKPFATYVDGMLCSAGYWFGSQTGWIVANQHNYATIGSIGTLCMLVDQTEWLKKEGLKVTVMRANQSTDKARLNGYEEAPAEAMEALQAELNAITEDFISAVKAGRGTKLNAGKENIFTGKTYSKEEAMQMGMIDQIGTLEDAVNMVLQLATSSASTTPNQQNINSNKNSEMKADKIFAILGIGKSSVEGKLSEEQIAALDAAEDKLAAIETANTEAAAQLQASIDALTSEKTSLEEKNASLAGQVSSLQAQADEKDAKIALLESNGESNAGAFHESDQNGGSGTPAIKDEQAHRFAALGKTRNQSGK